MTDVQNDPDRVVAPAAPARGRRRRSSAVSWEEALDDIGAAPARRARAPRAGSRSAGTWATPARSPTRTRCGSRASSTRSARRTTTRPCSQDVDNRFAASALLYGAPLLVPIPDLARTNFLLMVGANPLVSHGSVLTAPQRRDQLHDDRRARRARRRRRPAPHARPRASSSTSPCAPTPTPGCCCRCCTCSSRRAWPTSARSRAQTEGCGSCARGARSAFAAGDDGARARASTADVVRALARDLAAADGAAVYGRTGSCLGRFGTLVAFLLDALNAGDRQPRRPRRRGLRPPGDRARRGRRAGRASTPTASMRSRIGDFPDVIGDAARLADGARDDDARRAADPRVLRQRGQPGAVGCPTATRWRRRSASWTSACRSTSTSTRPTATPTTSCRRRPGWSATTCRSPSSASTRRRSCSGPTPVVAPRGEAREEWQIVDATSRTELGVAPYSVPALRRLARLGLALTPAAPGSTCCCARARDGDRFGLRPRGLSLKWLRQPPARRRHRPAPMATGVLPRRVRHRDWRVRLDAPRSRGELRAAGGRRTAHDPAFPLRLIGLRELRSHNSWMHNAPLLMRGGARRTPLRMHPDDAARARAAGRGRGARSPRRPGRSRCRCASPTR